MFTYQSLIFIVKKGEAKDILIAGADNAGNEDDTEERILEVETKTAAFFPHCLSASSTDWMHC